jgi:hypothetical protein
MDNICWECDYPHSDSTWPFSPEEVAAHFTPDVSDHDIDRITHLNAMRHFQFDPFAVQGGRENCTVGALRARAKGHDVSIKSTNPAKVGQHKVQSVDLAAVTTSR